MMKIQTTNAPIASVTYEIGKTDELVAEDTQ